MATLHLGYEGSPKDCRNYRGITLLSVPGKVFATVLLNKVNKALGQKFESCLPTEIVTHSYVDISKARIPLAASRASVR